MLDVNPYPFSEMYFLKSMNIIMKTGTMSLINFTVIDCKKDC